jgi:hypothetical protein
MCASSWRAEIRTKFKKEGIMAIEYINQIKISGEEGKLKELKLKLAGDNTNGPLSFHNIIEVPVRSDELDNHVPSESSCSERYWKYWGTPCDAIASVVYKENKGLLYKFITRYTDANEIFDFLVSEYPEFDFICHVDNDFDFTWYEKVSKRGKIIEEDYWYWESEPYEDGKFKDILYNKSYPSNTVQIIEERIFHPSEYDEATHYGTYKKVDIPRNQSQIE